MRTVHFRTVIHSLIIASFGVVGQAYGGVIFTNFNSDPDHLYDGSNAWEVDEGTKQAMPFVPLGNWDWVLTQIDVALQSDFGTDSAILTLNSDSAGQPGGVLAIWNLSRLPLLNHLADSCCLVDTVLPTSSPVLLSSGVQYWLVASAVGNTEADAWMFNDTGSTGGGSLFRFGTWSPNPLSTLGAFDVQGMAPESASLLMFSAGVLALGGLCIINKCLRYVLIGRGNPRTMEAWPARNSSDRSLGATRQAG
jgi:hypothetical protein